MLDGDHQTTHAPLSVATATGGWTIATADGAVALADVRPAMTYWIAGRLKRWSPKEFSTDGRTLVAAGGPDGLSLRATAEDDHGDLVMDVSCENGGQHVIGVESLTVAAVEDPTIGGDPGSWSMYRNGHQSWSGTRTLRQSERDVDIPTEFLRRSTTDAKHKAPSDPGHVRSDLLSAVEHRGQRVAVGLGFLTTAAMFGFVELRPAAKAHRQLSAWCDLDATELVPGDTVESERLCITACAGPSAGSAALERLARRTGEAMDARLDGGHPGGWCSWYYYFHRVTEDDIIGNLEVLSADGRDGPAFGCSYVMVDDGYQRGIGNWLATNSTFPSGMASVASRIRDAGFDAGIWWAPFIVAGDAPVAREHPDWLLRNDRGKPVVALLNPAWGRRRLLALDTTHPGVLEHLRHVARTITVEWGYRIQKLDFVFAASLPGVHHTTATRAAALRQGLAAIRDGAGEDAFLLGCGSPMGPAIGIVDAMRIGADVTPSWTSGVMQIAQRRLHGLSTEHAIRNILTRAFMDARLWDNDPDCLMVRSEDTTLTVDEVRTLATVIGMTNGMTVLSDPLDALPADRVEMVRKTRELTGGAFRALDLFDSGIPTAFASMHRDHVDVARFNLDEDARTLAFDLATLGLDVADQTLTEWWTGDAVSVAGNRIEFPRVPTHGTRVCRVPLSPDVTAPGGAAAQ